MSFLICTIIPNMPKTQINKLMKFSVTRVVTKNIAIDAFQGLRNILGLRLRGYEHMLNKNIQDLISEIENTYNTSWYRLSINPITKGGVMITIYGEGNKK